MARLATTLRTAKALLLLPLVPLLLQRSVPSTLTRWWTWSSKHLLMSSMRLKRPTCKVSLWCVLVDGWQRSPTCASKTKVLHHFVLAVNTSCDIWSGWKFRVTPWTQSPSRSAINLFDGHARWMELPVHFANASGRIVLGATPMLLGRPVLEQLGAVVD